MGKIKIAAGIYISNVSREKSSGLALPTMLGWLRPCYTENAYKEL